VRQTCLAFLFVVVLCGADARAQQPDPSAKAEIAKPPAPPKNPQTPLTLQITISRYQGEKKISSLPYTLSVSVGGPRVNFRAGAQVPYATTAVNDGVKTPSYSYRDVGIGIDVIGQVLVEPGLYKMDVHVNDSSISSSNQIQGAPTITGVPIFRNFSTNGSVLLRDGQTRQLTTASDPITGETMRVDVTLSVVK
jgi:hypothetical protein